MGKIGKIGKIRNLGNLGNLRNLGRSTTNILKFPNLIKFSKFTDQPPQSAHSFSLEVPRFVTKSKLPWKGVYLAYISFQGNELGGEGWGLSREIHEK